MQLTGLIFFEKNRLWFGIYNSYAIKRIMRLSDMQLTRFVCKHSPHLLLGRSALWV